MLNLETITKEELIKAMRDANVDPETLDTRRYLGWGAADVTSAEVRPDLTEEDALNVLDRVVYKHDCTLGVTWNTLKITADEMFPLNPNSNA